MTKIRARIRVRFRVRIRFCVRIARMFRVSVRVVRMYDEYHHKTTHARMMCIFIEKEKMYWFIVNIP